MTADGSLLCLFSARLAEDDGSLVIDVPEREVSQGPLEPGGTYRVGLVPASGKQSTPRRQSKATAHDGQDKPPVEAGEILEVEIEDIGDKGDGVARIDSGFIVFVPDTTLHERVTVEVTDVRETMAFAEVIGRHDSV